MKAVFLHGLNNDAGVWDPVCAVLDDNIDSQAPMLPPIEDIDEIADWVADQYEGTAALVGHSFGGAVVQAVYDRHPEKVSALVMINASIRSDSETAAQGRMERIGQLHEEADYLQMATGAPEKLYAPENVSRSDILETRKKSVAIYGMERFKAHSKALATRPDRTDVVAKADIPLLVIAAGGDVVIPTERQQQWAEEVGADFEVIAETGHMLPAEQPEKLGEVINDFLQSAAGKNG